MFKKIIITVLLFSLALFTIVSSLSSKEEPIRVSGGVTSESQILGHIVVQLLEHHTDADVDFYNNLGSANIMHAAMVRGDIDIAATRYTGTDLIDTLQLPVEKNPDVALNIVQNTFKERFNFNWFPSYGFSNQFTFMVTQETAEKYQLKTVSDLKQHVNALSLGTDQTWYKRLGDGYQGFTKAYDMSFDRVYPMQIGLLYDALNTGDLDVILGYSTDGRVKSYDLIMLEDDRQFFPPYTASLVANEILIDKNPKIELILNQLSGTIDTETMQEMNDASDRLLIEPAVIAKAFLEAHHYFEEAIK